MAKAQNLANVQNFSINISSPLVNASDGKRWQVILNFIKQ